MTHGEPGDECIDEDAGLFVYPFEQTHVTLATVVDFRRSLGVPPVGRRSVRERSGRVVRRLAGILRYVKAFEIGFGQPVAGRRACFFEFSDPSGEVHRLRTQLRAVAPAGLPDIIHSTFARYRAAPHDPTEWLHGFDKLAGSVPAAFVRIEEILVVIETRPYLCSGEVISRHSL